MYQKFTTSCTFPLKEVQKNLSNIAHLWGYSMPDVINLKDQELSYDNGDCIFCTSKKCAFNQTSAYCFSHNGLFFQSLVQLLIVKIFPQLYIQINSRLFLSSCSSLYPILRGLEAYALEFLEPRPKRNPN